jgi:hypothetical protein
MGKAETIRPIEPKETGMKVSGGKELPLVQKINQDVQLMKDGKLLPGLTKTPQEIIPKQPLVQAQNAIEALPDMAGDVVGGIGESLNKLNTNIIQPNIQKVQSAIQPVTQAVQRVTAPTPTPSTNRPDLPKTIQVNNQTKVKQYDPNVGFTYQAPTPPKAVAPAPTPKPTLATVITGAAGQAANKVQDAAKKALQTLGSWSTKWW